MLVFARLSVTPSTQISPCKGNEHRTCACLDTSRRRSVGVFRALREYTRTLRLVCKHPDLRVGCANSYAWLCHARSSIRRYGTFALRAKRIASRLTSKLDARLTASLALLHLVLKSQMPRRFAPRVTIAKAHPDWGGLLLW